MLKSLGLWKSLYEDDSYYPQDNDHFEFVEDNSDDKVLKILGIFMFTFEPNVLLLDCNCYYFFCSALLSSKNINEMR